MKFSSNFFGGNGLKWKFSIVWFDPEGDSDLRDREVALFRGEGLFCSVLTMMEFDNWTLHCISVSFWAISNPKPLKKPLKRPPMGTLGVAKCQNVKIQCFPSHWNWFWIWNRSKSDKNTMESSVVKFHHFRDWAEKAPPLKRVTSRSRRSELRSGSIHTMVNFHLSPFPPKKLLENFSTITK